MTAGEMTREQARAVFDKEIASAGTDEDRVAKLELMREYFTNPAYRRALEAFAWTHTRAGGSVRAG